MLSWLKRRLVDWAEKVQKQEIARLAKENKRLKEQIERETGKSVQLTPTERRILVEKSRGIDPEVLKKISVLEQEENEAQAFNLIRPREPNNWSRNSIQQTDLMFS